MTAPVLTITAQLDLAAWEHEARGAHGEWVELYHGTNRVEKAASIKAEGLKADRYSHYNNVLTKRKDEAGYFAGKRGAVVTVRIPADKLDEYTHGTSQGLVSLKKPLPPGMIHKVEPIEAANSVTGHSLDLAAPAPPPPQQQQVPPGQQVPAPTGAAEAALVTALAGLLLTAVSVAAVLEALKLRFALGRDLQRGLGAVLGVVMSSPPPVTGVIGAASAQTSRQNHARRAQFVLSAGKRLTGDIRQARAQGKPVIKALADGLARERRYYQMHQKAMWDRATAAGQIDMEAATHGPLLGWYTKHTPTTTAECLAADRHNFYVNDPPDIGLPGIGPHVGCRCQAGPPHPGGKLLPSRGARYARAA